MLIIKVLYVCNTWAAWRGGPGARWCSESRDRDRVQLVLRGLATSLLMTPINKNKLKSVK